MENDGGNAFPQVESQRVGSGGEYHTEIYSAGGMTLRDYFAAKAMQSAMVNARLPGLVDRDPAAMRAIASVSDISYMVADAMLKARQS